MSSDVDFVTNRVIFMKLNFYTGVLENICNFPYHRVVISERINFFVVGRHISV